MTDPPQALYRTFLIFGDQDDTQDKDSKLNGTETECTDWANKHFGLRTFFLLFTSLTFSLGSNIATDGGIFGVHADSWKFENDIGNGNGMETGVLNERQWEIEAFLGTTNDKHDTHIFVSFWHLVLTLFWFLFCFNVVYLLFRHFLWESVLWLGQLWVCMR
jgi:hypothetical protein